jgi:hypothetical protein
MRGGVREMGEMRGGDEEEMRGEEDIKNYLAYLGCYQYNSTSGNLNDASLTSQSLNISECINICRQDRYTYLFLFLYLFFLFFVTKIAHEKKLDKIKKICRSNERRRVRVWDKIR